MELKWPFLRFSNGFYKKAYEINNTYVDAIHNLGNAYFKTYDLVNASKFLNLAISLDPNFSEAYNSLGMVFYFKQQLNKQTDEKNYCNAWLTESSANQITTSSGRKQNKEGSQENNR